MCLVGIKIIKSASTHTKYFGSSGRNSTANILEDTSDRKPVTLAHKHLGCHSLDLMINFLSIEPMNVKQWQGGIIILSSLIGPMQTYYDSVCVFLGALYAHTYTYTRIVQTFTQVVKTLDGLYEYIASSI